MKGTKVLGLAVVGALLVIAAHAQQAQAMSLSNPGAAAVVQQNSKDAVTEVSWHGHWHHHHGWHHHHWHRHYGWHRHHWHHHHWHHR